MPTWLFCSNETKQNMNGIGTMFIFIAQQCTGDYLRAVPGSRVKLSVSDYKADVATGMLFYYSDLPLLFFFIL